MTRRTLLQGGTASAAVAGGLALSRRAVPDQSSRKILFTMDLRCSSIGVRADQRRAIQLAGQHGFESVTPDPGFLAELSEDSRTKLLDEMASQRLVWGAAGLPVEFRGDEQTFLEGIRQLPQLARGMHRAGVTRVGTWLAPSHDELTYLANFRQHARRLRTCAEILGSSGLRLGLEYVGPKTSWTSKRHSFIHTMAETKELIAEIGLDNVGFVLDSWHWYTAQETDADLRTLRTQDVIACDLNDAPAGIPVEQQVDSRRELPAATGVIDLRGFLSVLVEMEYDGPIRAEPFNRSLNELPDEAAVAATADAMRAAFTLVGRRD